MINVLIRKEQSVMAARQSRVTVSPFLFFVYSVRMYRKYGEK